MPDLLGLFDQVVARLVFVVWFLAGAGMTAVALGLGWLSGYLSRCRDEREGQLLSQEWQADRRRKEAQREEPA